jgi:hypothetical protein
MQMTRSPLSYPPPILFAAATLDVGADSPCECEDCEGCADVAEGTAVRDRTFCASERQQRRYGRRHLDPGTIAGNSAKGSLCGGGGREHKGRCGLRTLACSSASSASFVSFSFDATEAAAPLISITSENEIKRAPEEGR